MNWLKTVMMAAVAAIQSLFSMIVGALVSAAKAVVGFFSAVGAAISSAVGGIVSTATAGIASFVAVIVAAAGVAGAVRRVRETTLLVMELYLRVRSLWITQRMPLRGKW